MPPSEGMSANEQLNAYEKQQFPHQHTAADLVVVQLLRCSAYFSSLFHRQDKEEQGHEHTDGNCSFMMDICVLQQRVNAENGIIWFHHRCGNLRASPNGEAQFRLLAIINRETFQHETAETRAGAAAHCILGGQSMVTLMLL